MPADRFSTATRLRTLGEHAAARVYRSRPTPPRRSRLTGRAALLALVICSLVVAIAYPMRQYISQRSDIAEQRRQAESIRDKVGELRDEKARLEDPAYVRQLARAHLDYLLPGERGYRLPDAGSAEGSEDQGSADQSWYSDFWDDVDRADRG